MSDEAVLEIFLEIKKKHDEKATLYARLEKFGVSIDPDGLSIEERIQREYCASQRVEAAMRPIRDRLASK
jgi:hypothetical protein